MRIDGLEQTKTDWLIQAISFHADRTGKNICILHTSNSILSILNDYLVYEYYEFYEYCFKLVPAVYQSV